MAALLTSNASTAAAGTSPEGPPVFGSCCPSGIVSRITSFLREVLSPVVADPAVLAPVVSAVLAPVVSPLVVLVAAPVVSVVPVVVPVVDPVVPVVLVPVVCCPHAGNANTTRKVRAAKIVLMYGTDSPPSRYL